MLGASSYRGLSRIVVFSIVVHVVALAAAVFAGQVRLSGHRTKESVLVTKLVRFGKERPKNYLPRLEASTPVPPVPISAQAAQPKSEAPEAAQASAKTRVNELNQVSRALERLKGQKAEAPVGHESGVRDGEAEDLEHAVAGNLYATEIYRCLKDNYAILGVNPATVKNRSAVVLLSIDQMGNFLDYRIVRGSGIAAFDSAVERAVKSCGKVSPPPPDMREQVRDGLEVEFQL